MDYDLQSALRALSASTPLPDRPIAHDAVMARVRRGRAVRVTVTAAVSAAAAVATAIAVQAAPWRDDTAPVAPSPIRSASAEPSPVPTPTPTPTTPPVTETPDPVDPSPPIVALTEAGEVVLLDPASGETLEVVAQDPGFVAGTMDVDEARAFVYLTREQDPGSDSAGAEVVRVSLVDGTVETVGAGWGPALSPDGSTLAYLGPLEGVPTYERFAERALVVLDLVTGEALHVPDGGGGTPMRTVEEPAWSGDGSQVLVGTGFGGENGPGNSGISVVDPQDPPTTLEDAEMLPGVASDDSSSFHQAMQAFSLPDARLVLDEYTDTLVNESEWTGARNLVVLERGTVEVRVGLPVTVPDDEPAGIYVTGVSGDPTGPEIAVILQRWNWETEESTGSLWLWDGRDGFVELRQDVIAAAW